ncbi:MAG: HEAT repeat domain-containing protein [Planctomycetes bacterium]|nr:HEAT repeat domain-containing protein [Planctomycetota bacterium]
MLPILPSFVRAALLGALVLVAPAAAQAPPGSDPARPAPGAPGGPAPVQGAALADLRTRMWYAPTAEDWKKPCLIAWQRTWEDAVAVSQRTKKALLVCVNMDGEIASEHYAGVRYREPEKAKLYTPYVCVIASVYRHTPRDFDEQGVRIPCPRFGTVTCGEHIAIEPVLFEKFMDGKRIAPRHIGVELDANEMYDVYYAWDTDTIFTSLAEGIAHRPPPPPDTRGDLSIEARVASPDVLDRVLVETAFVKGDWKVRRKLVEAAITNLDVSELDLLRLALKSGDPELAQLARRGLAESKDPLAADLIAEALRAPLEEVERAALVAALVRLAETSPRARTLAAVYQGLTARSGAVDVDAWSRALQEHPPGRPIVERSVVDARLCDYEAAARRADDPAALLARAEAFFQLAEDQKSEPRYVRHALEDARRVAREAEAAGAKGWKLGALLALTAAGLGDRAEALKRALETAPALPPDAPGALGGGVLALFAEARQQAIWKAVREKQEWPTEWLSDLDAAYSVLARHPLGTEGQVAAHYDLLAYLGGTREAGGILERGLDRFPDSPALHERFRGRVLAERGAAGLAPAYDALIAKRGAQPNLEWFAGYATFVAAEYEKRAGRDAEAEAAYGAAVQRYERAIRANPECKASADHYVALAFAARAWLAYERGADERAVDELLASFQRKPEAAASLDGMNRSPVSTAKVVLARLQEQKQEALAARLDGALKALDPTLLLPPEYDRETGGPSPDARRGRRGPPRSGR